MSNINTTSQQLYNLLVSRNFEPKPLDTMGKPAESPGNANLFSFNFKTENKNYGTVVILLDTSQDMQLYYGDNLGKGMEAGDKSEWYDFLYMVRMLAKRNMYTFSLDDMTKLKHNMSTIAAMTEGTLLEGYYGTKKTSYSDQPMKTRLIIKHNRSISEGDQRFRNVESLFVETAEGERFKLPFINLSGGKAMARHIAEGGNPYDAFGQHISDIVKEIATLGRFNRATRNKQFGNDAQHLAEQAVEHYKALKRKVKKIIGRRGYHEELSNFDPITITELDKTMDAVRETFLQQTLDQRVEDALPILARIQETNMKELDEFMSWADNIVEGTWAVPNDLKSITQFKKLMADPLPVGVDASNATEQLYGIFGDDQLFDDLEDLAAKDPDADARPVIQNRLDQMGINIDDDEADLEEVADIDTGEQVLKAQRDPMLEDELARLLKLSK